MIYTFNGIPVEYADACGFSGTIAIRQKPIEKKDLEIKWLNSPVPKRIVRTFVSWARHVYDEYGGECQARIYYRRDDDSWAIAVKKQYISHGLESSEVGDDGDEEECRKQLPKNGSWILFGTIHSHCGSEAFMSPTDYRNEIKQDGIHITVGCIDQKHYEIHYRVSLRGIIYELGKECDDVHVEAHDQSTKLLPKYSELWNSMLIPRPVVKSKGVRVIGGHGMRTYLPTVPRANSMEQFFDFINDGYELDEDKKFNEPYLSDMDDEHFDAVITLLSSIYTGDEIDLAKMLFNKALDKVCVTVVDDQCLLCGRSIQSGGSGLCQDCEPVNESLPF